MPMDFQSFVNPSQFSDAATYSGLGGQMPSLKEVAQKAALAELSGGASGASSGGVAPPPQSVSQAFDGFMKQAIAPVTNTINNFQSGFNKASQAFNSITSPSTAKPQNVGEQHDHEW